KKCLTALGMLLVASGCVSKNELGHLAATHFGDLSYGEPAFGAFDHELDAACGSAGELTEAGDAALVRKPYLQRMAAERGEVMFGSDREAGVEIFAPAGGRDDQSQSSIVSPAPVAVDASGKLPHGQQRVAPLERFEPGSINCYQIRGSEGAWTEPTGFRTAPAPGGLVRFSALGDVGMATSDQFAVLDQLMNVSSDFVLVNGDVAYGSGTREEFQSYFFDVYEPMLSKVPFFPALGNHDAKTEGGAPLLEAFALP